MRAAWLVVLVACGGGADPPAAPPVTSSTPSAKAVVQPPIGPSTGMHGAAIELVAVADSGDAAVSADTTGALRLWPSLDGTREPVVVTGSRPHALDIARDVDGYVIANHDAARGLELLRLDARGVVRTRVKIATEPAVEQVELTSEGALVLRADQTIELYDMAGMQRARLVPDPGTRISAIVGRAGRVLAIVGDHKAVHARWIDVGTATWGAMSPKLPIDPSRPVALSPDHTRIVGSLRNKLRTPAFVDLASGKQEPTDLCATLTDDARRESSLADDGAPVFDEFLPTALGFIDASTVACLASGRLVWWKTDGVEIPANADGAALPGVLEPAIGSRRVVGSLGSQLAVFDPGTPRYLGYSFRELSHLRMTPIGILIGKGDQAPLLLDGSLHELVRYPLPKGDLEWADLLPLDERYVLRMSARKVMADAWGSAYQITVFDMTKGIVHQQLPNLAQEVTLAYEPATHLLSTSDGPTNLLLRYDPTTHSFGERFEVHEPVALRAIHLLDPALSGGLVALTIEDRNDGVTIGELHGDDLHGPTIRVRRTYSVQGQLRSVDRSGRVYMQGAAATDVVVHARGTQFARLAGLGGMALRPSPDARHVTAFRDQKVRLLTVEGGVVWDVALWGSADIDWTSGGELIARFPAGLARLDRATGTLRERQCGWSFGIADKPFDVGGDLPMVCDVSP